MPVQRIRFNALSGLSCYFRITVENLPHYTVSMPSRAWVVTCSLCGVRSSKHVSMPSRAWVVTARMSNILNFSWCFLCIPAIYRCILAYLPIFFNQLSKFLRCESPSTFLGTCLSHHSFIIFLVTNTNTLLSGLYLISTVPLQKPRFYAVSRACFCRYLSEYSDNSSFSCMLTFWTYLMRCTFPWHCFLPGTGTFLLRSLRLPNKWEFILINIFQMLCACQSEPLWKIKRAK